MKDTIIKLGLSPFARDKMPHQICSLLRYLSDQAGGPVQIEGAFDSPTAEIPFLYQLHKTSVPEVSKEAIEIQDRHLFAGPVRLMGVEYTRVVGRARFTGPLIYIDDPLMDEDWDFLKELDREFQDGGYILLAGKQKPSLIAGTPHCLIRLSQASEHVGSHATTYTRDLIHETPKKGYVLASSVKGVGSLQTIKACDRHSLSWAIQVWMRCDFHSNGYEMSARIL